MAHRYHGGIHISCHVVVQLLVLACEAAGLKGRKRHELR
jgi:hypothetical protein